jgi:hypothetical protein
VGPCRLDRHGSADPPPRSLTQGTYGEAEAARLLRRLLETVAFTHDMGVVHRDIKLDNLLLGDAAGDAASLKLVDWGFSTFTRPAGPPLRGLCGTSYYIAPVRGGAGRGAAHGWRALTPSVRGCVSLRALAAADGL